MAKYIDKEVDYDYVWILKQQINKQNEKTTTYITLLTYDWVWANNLCA